MIKNPVLAMPAAFGVFEVVMQYETHDVRAIRSIKCKVLSKKLFFWVL